MHTEQLGDLWERVNALGAPDSACRTDEDRAYCRAIGDVLKVIERDIAEEIEREGASRSARNVAPVDRRTAA